MTDLPEEQTGPLTRLHNFMYILSELERAVELGGIEWDAASVDMAQRRLDRLAAIMQRIAAGFRHHIDPYSQHRTATAPVPPKVPSHSPG
jgi:hypothetical protein